MATLTSMPSLSIDIAPFPNQRRITVRYEIQFDAFDLASDQPYAEIVTLIGDDTGVAGDPPVAAPDDVLQVISMATVRPSMNGGGTLARNHVRLVALTTLDEDRLDAPDPDEIRAVVSLTPQAPAALTAESNLVRIGQTFPQTTTVPDVIGDDRGTAERSVIKAGLVPSVGGPDRPENVVVTQNPQPGAIVNRGRTVRMFLGPPPPPE